MATHSLEKQAVQIARRRWWLMLAYLISWFLWQAFMLEPVRALPVLHGVPVVAIGLGAWAVWMVTLLLLFAFMARVRRDRRLSGMLNDELSAANRRRCFSAGYFALLFALAAAMVVATFRWVDSLTLVQMLMMVAVSVPLLSFVWLERDTGD